MHIADARLGTFLLSLAPYKRLSAWEIFSVIEQVIEEFFFSSFVSSVFTRIMSVSVIAECAVDALPIPRVSVKSWDDQRRFWRESFRDSCIFDRPSRQDRDPRGK